MLVTGRGEDQGANQPKTREGGSQYGESSRRKTGVSGREMQGGESKAKAGNQQQMDSKVKGAPGSSQQQVEGGGTPTAGAAAGSGGPDQQQENGNR